MCAAVRDGKRKSAEAAQPVVSPLEKSPNSDARDRLPRIARQVAADRDLAGGEGGELYAERAELGGAAVLGGQHPRAGIGEREGVLKMRGP